MSKLLSGEQVAALAGISSSAVSKVKNADDALHRQAGGYDPREVGRWLHRRALASVGKSGEGLDLSREQTLLARARREALEHDAEIKRGKYILHSTAATAARAGGIAIRDAVLSVPARVCNDLAAFGSDAGEIERALMTALRDELRRLGELECPGDEAIERAVESLRAKAND